MIQNKTIFLGSSYLGVNMAYLDKNCENFTLFTKTFSTANQLVRKLSIKFAKLGLIVLVSSVTVTAKSYLRQFWVALMLIYYHFLEGS